MSLTSRFKNDVIHWLGGYTSEDMEGARRYNRWLKHQLITKEMDPRTLKPSEDGVDQEQGEA